MRTIAEIISDIRQKADECHNNNGDRTSEDWERMTKYLLGIADELDAAIKSEKEVKIPAPKPSESLVGRVREIVVEQLGVNFTQVTDDASFVDDLGADLLDLEEMTFK